MPVEQIPFGVPTPIVQNVIYALPVPSGWLFSTVALEFGSAVGGPFAANAASTTGLATSAGFFRCPSAAAVVTIRKA